MLLYVADQVFPLLSVAFNVVPGHISAETELARFVAQRRTCAAASHEATTNALATIKEPVQSTKRDEVACLRSDQSTPLIGV